MCVLIYVASSEYVMFIFVPSVYFMSLPLTLTRVLTIPLKLTRVLIIPLKWTRVLTIPLKLTRVLTVVCASHLRTSASAPELRRKFPHGVNCVSSVHVRVSV